MTILFCIYFFFFSETSHGAQALEVMAINHKNNASNKCQHILRGTRNLSYLIIILWVGTP